MNHSPSARLTFYFDFISPYAFLAWTQIRSLAARHEHEVVPIPILFAGLLEAHGTKGPAEVPAKRLYLLQDVPRKAHRLGVTNLAPPPAHPFNPLTALRVASLPDLDRESQLNVIDALYLAAWTKRTAIDTPDAVASVLNGIGMDGAKLVAEAQTDASKARVRAATDAAIKKGIFGVPTIAVGDGEMFWGTDSLVDLEMFLKGEMPDFSNANAGRWSELPVGIMRKSIS